MGIEGRQEASLISGKAGGYAPQRILGDEERRLHGAVVTPEADRAPRRVISAAGIGKVQRHPRGLVAQAPGARMVTHAWLWPRSPRRVRPARTAGCSARPPAQRGREWF